MLTAPRPNRPRRPRAARRRFLRGCRRRRSACTRRGQEPSQEGSGRRIDQGPPRLVCGPRSPLSSEARAPDGRLDSPDPTMDLRPAASTDADAIWSILEPIVRAGETFALPREMSRDSALAWWHSPGERGLRRRGQRGRGPRHLLPPSEPAGARQPRLPIAATRPQPRATGRGIARAMCAHSLRARARPRLPRDAVQHGDQHQRARGPPLDLDGLPDALPDSGAFLHPTRGFVDALVMFREL